MDTDGVMPSVFIYLTNKHSGGEPISKELRINEEIRARDIRVVSDTNEQLGVMPLRDALAAAIE